MGSLFSSPSLPPLPAPVTGPASDDAETEAAAERERKRQAAAASRSNDIRTGVSGLTEDAPVKKKTLLGNAG